MPNDAVSNDSSNVEFIDDVPATRVVPSNAPKAVAAVLVVGLAGAIAVHMWKTSSARNSTAEAADVVADVTPEAEETPSPTIQFDPLASRRRAEELAEPTTQPKSSYSDARRKASAAADARRLDVESVTVVGKNSSCVINGKRLTEGGKVSGFRVQRFTGGAVVVAKDGFLFELRPRTSEAAQRSDPARDGVSHFGGSFAAGGTAKAGPRDADKKPGPTVWAPPEPPKRHVEDAGSSTSDSSWDSKWGSNDRPHRVGRSSGTLKARNR